MIATIAGVIVGVLMTAGCATAAGNSVSEGPPPTMEEQWGIEVVGLRLTAANYMLDFRYKVLDADKAAPIFDRATKPVLIHKATGAELPVPRPAKTGPLRPSNAPQVDRIYFMFFSNPGIVKVGDEVAVVIGDFRAEMLVE